MEIASAYAWVKSTASADSALVAAASGGIWLGLADISVTEPFMSYGRQSDVDVMTLQAIRLWAGMLLQIKAVGPTAQYAALVIIADRIDELFKNQRNIPLASGGVLACYRDGQVAYEDPKLINGAAWSHLGGLYRIDLQGS